MAPQWVKEYVEKHKLQVMFEEAVNAVVKARAEEPMAFLVSGYTNECRDQHTRKREDLQHNAAKKVVRSKKEEEEDRFRWITFTSLTFYSSSLSLPPSFLVCLLGLPAPLCVLPLSPFRLGGVLPKASEETKEKR